MMIRGPTLLLNHCRQSPALLLHPAREPFGGRGSKTKHVLLSQDSKFFRKLRFVDRPACSILKTSMLLQFEFQTTVPQNKQPSQPQTDLGANVNKLSQRVAACVALNHH